MLVFNAVPSSIQAAHVHDIYIHYKKKICCFNYRVVTVVAVKLKRQWLEEIYRLIA